MFEEIIFFEEEIDADGFFGILQEIKKENGISQEVQAKILCSTDEEGTVFDLASRVVLNSESVKEIKVYEKLHKTTFNPTVIYYKPNENGEIIFIDTPSESVVQAEGGKSLLKIRRKDDDGLQYKSQNKNFGMRYYPNASGVVQFGIPLDNSGNPDWNNAQPTILKNDKTYNLELYALTDNSDTIIYDVAVAFDVVTDEATIDKQQPLCVVTDIRKVIYDEEDLYELTLNEANEEINLFVGKGSESILDNIDKGDIIRYGLDNKGYVRLIEHHYDYSEDTFPMNTEGTGNITIYERNLFCYGTVSNFESDYVTIITDAAVLPDPYAFNIKHSIIYRVDERTGDVVVTVPSKEDIKDTAHFGTTTQRAIMHSRSGLTYASVASVIIDR